MTYSACVEGLTSEELLDGIASTIGALREKGSEWKLWKIPFDAWEGLESELRSRNIFWDESDAVRYAIVRDGLETNTSLTEKGVL